MKDRRITLSNYFFPLACLLGFMVVSLQAWGLTILIDPGHGGEDIGARKELIIEHVVGKEKILLLEKDIGLQLAKKIYEHLKLEHKVFLTRSVDRTVSLEQRSEMAEKVNADLFISVHVNSSAKTSSHGLETYYLDNHDDVAIRKIESVENPRLKGSDLIANQILIDLLIQRTAPSSKKLGDYVHASIREKVTQKFNMVDRGVKAGLFYVLALSKRPSILLEAGFISNSDEAKKLIDPVYQDYYAKAVAEGIHRFVKDGKISELAKL